MRLFKKKPEAPLETLSRPRRDAAARPPHADRREDALMLKDPMVLSALAVKRHGVLAAPWRLEGDPVRAAFIKRAFERMEGSPLTLLAGAMDAFARGLSVQETFYEEDAEGIWLHSTRLHDPEAFGLRFSPAGRLTGLVWNGSEGTEGPRELDLARFLVFRYGAGPYAPRGLPDLEPVREHWRQKRELLDAWRRHLARFGSPTLLGAYESGMDQATVDETFAALRDLPKSQTILHPKGVEVRSIGADRDSSTGFLDAIEFHNREIARAILGQTLATDEGRRTGSLSLGKVHFQVLLLALQALRRTLADEVMTEGVIRPLLEMNFGPGPLVRFVFDEPTPGAFATGMA